MNIMLSIFFIFFVIISISLQSYSLMRKKAYKLVIIQFGIIFLALIGGIFIINNPYSFSIAQLFLKLIPWI